MGRCCSWSKRSDDWRDRPFIKATGEENTSLQEYTKGCATLSKKTGVHVNIGKDTNT